MFGCGGQSKEEAWRGSNLGRGGEVFGQGVRRQFVPAAGCVLLLLPQAAALQILPNTAVTSS